MTTIKVQSLAEKFATRESGAAARELVLQQLSQAGDAPVSLDFEGIEPTPSFADEFVGRLAEELGEECFRKRVRFVNLREPARTLLQNVVTKRLRAGNDPSRSSLCASP
jgi:hypothetical protein